MPTKSDNTDFMLGQIMEGVTSLRRDIEAMRDDFDQEKEHAHISRRDVHQKIDTLAGRVGQVETKIEVAGKVTAQTRDRIDDASLDMTERMDGFEAKLSNDVIPTVDEFKRLKLMGRGAIIAAGIAGGSLGLTAAAWGEHALNVVRGWLRIP